ncbi:hypothetical protein T265_08729 [Opisthorchis viverrini]|uniref:Uncharacterized protein n=1 Tax=Opisthorchis viverrini TaxID=6198 RepID=A0A074ZJ76_OPIVI|nr:hypothetical protein T265_08729 [Opisthorchis viverrini]KER23405.1 hypothetical protein T265_08729 [Opisthorchis viverrini]
MPAHIDREQKGEQQFVLFKQRATYIAVQGISQVRSQICQALIQVLRFLGIIDTHNEKVDEPETKLIRVFNHRITQFDAQRTTLFERLFQEQRFQDWIQLLANALQQNWSAKLYTVLQSSYKITVREFDHLQIVLLLHILHPSVRLTRRINHQRPSACITNQNVKRPLQYPYDGPFKVISRKDKYFVIERNGKPDSVSIDRLKVAFIDDESHSDPPTVVTPPTSSQTSSTAIPGNPEHIARRIDDHPLPILKQTRNRSQAVTTKRGVRCDGVCRVGAMVVGSDERYPWLASMLLVHKPKYETLEFVNLSSVRLQLFQEAFSSVSQPNFKLFAFDLSGSAILFKYIFHSHVPLKDLTVDAHIGWVQLGVIHQEQQTVSGLVQFTLQIMHCHLLSMIDEFGELHHMCNIGWYTIGPKALRTHSPVSHRKQPLAATTWRTLPDNGVLEEPLGATRTNFGLMDDYLEREHFRNKAYQSATKITLSAAHEDKQNEKPPGNNGAARQKEAI